MRELVVTSLDQAGAALEAAADGGRTVRLAFPGSISQALGLPAMAAIARLAEARMPAASVEWLVDCADRPGFALAAIRAGFKALRLEASPAVLARIADIAQQSGARLISEMPEAAPDNIGKTGS